MKAPDNQPLSEYMDSTLAKAKQWQSEHPDNPMVNAVLDHLMGRVDEAYAAQRFQAVSGYLRNIQEVMSGPEPREHVSGRVQIVSLKATMMPMYTGICRTIKDSYPVITSCSGNAPLQRLFRHCG